MRPRPQLQRPRASKRHRSGTRKLSIVIPLVVGLFALVVFGAFGVQILRRTETAAAKPVPAATRAAATEVAATVQVGGFPQDVAVNEANGTLYVTKSVPNTAKPSADSDDAEADRTPGTVVAVNMGSRSVSKEMTVGVEPNRIVVGVGGNYVYSTNTGSGTVSVVDAGAGQVIDTIKVETHPRGIALNPKLGATVRRQYRKQFGVGDRHPDARQSSTRSTSIRSRTRWLSKAPTTWSWFR